MVEPLVLESSPFQAEFCIRKLKRYKYPDTDQILVEVIQAGGNTISSEIQKPINSIRNEEELS
jgi:hypothetical protein